MDVNYIKSESMPIQEKWDAIVKRYGKEWTIKSLGGGNGN